MSFSRANTGGRNSILPRSPANPNANAEPESGGQRRTSSRLNPSNPTPTPRATGSPAPTPPVAKKAAIKKAEPKKTAASTTVGSGAASKPAPANALGLVTSTPARASGPAPSHQRRASVEDAVDDERDNRNINPLPANHPRILVNRDDVEGADPGTYDPNQVFYEYDGATKNAGKGREHQRSDTYNAEPYLPRDLFQGREAPPHMDSISRAAAGLRSPVTNYPLLFSSSGQSLNIRIEPLEASVANYHGVYDPFSIEDPLIHYGARKGLMPGKTAEETMILRDIVIRWAGIHHYLDGQTIEGFMGSFLDIQLSEELTSTFKDASGQMGYSLVYDLLASTGHLVLAVNQIYAGMNRYLGRSTRNAFILDPNYTFVRYLENADSLADLKIAFASLQHRLVSSDNRIQTFLFTIRKLNGLTSAEDEDDRQSATNSTHSSIRASFGLRSPRVELGKLLMRPDYEGIGDAVDPEAKLRLVAHAYDNGSLARDEFYRQGRSYANDLRSVAKETRFQVNPIQARRSIVEPPNHLSYAAPPDPAFGAYPMPASAVAFSKATPHQISRLPGMSFPDYSSARNPNYGGYTGFGGPSLMRPSIPSRGGRGISMQHRAILQRPGNVPPRTHQQTVAYLEARKDQSANFPGRAYSGGYGGGGGDDDDPDDHRGGSYGGAYRGGWPRGRGGFRGLGTRYAGAGRGVEFGGGGGGGGDGGDGGDDDYPYGDPDYVDPNDPYAYLPEPAEIEEWQLNHKIGLSDVPKWDGRGKTIIDYLCGMADLARFGPKVATALGQMAPLRWGGEAKEWWDSLSDHDKTWMGASWLRLVVFLRDQFMDEKWILDRTMEFDDMRFRQHGKESESPSEYYQRRKRYHAFLYPDEVDGPVAVARIIRLAPEVWRSKINENECPNIFTLMKKVRQSRDELVTLWRFSRKMDSYRDRSPGTGKSSYSSRPATVNAVDEGTNSESEDDYPIQEDFPASVDAEAHATYSKGKSGSGNNQRNRNSKTVWPEGGTFKGESFPRDDSVVSSRAPPGNCYVCASPKHYARDCALYGKFMALRDANLLDVALDRDVIAQSDRMYLAMLAECASSSSLLSPSDKSVRFEEPDAPSDEDLEDVALPSRTVLVVDQHAAVEAAAFHVGTSVSMNRNVRRRHATEKRKATKAPATPEFSTAPPRRIRRSRSALILSKQAEARQKAVDTAPPSKGGNTVVRVAKRRSFPDGMSSLGTRALHCRVRVGSLDAPMTRARVDSGADLSLVSEDFWKSMPDAPVPKEGLRIRLYHLTGHAKVLGYIKFNMYVDDVDGQPLAFEVEAYVVRDMRVPLLLGEDFQSSYEMGIQRYASGRSELLIDRGKYIIPASSAQQVDLGFEVRSANLAKGFIRAKATRRARAKARANPIAPTAVLAEEDALIMAGAVHNVKVTGPFEGRTDWLVEKVIIGTDDANIMAAPTTWISTDAPFIPIANPSTIPRYIKAGEVVGHLVDPSTSLDIPSNDEALSKMVASVEVMRTVIGGTLKAQELMESKAPSSSSVDDRLETDENWGPKTTALPDEPSTETDVAKLVNLGPDVPADILPRLEQVLRKNEMAFGVNGRLGEVNAQVPIPLVPDTKPISLPMYGASPAKREVIEKQVNAWFEAGVIEKSTSPWGAPVVVVYRNGKPRLVVDYRKLNAKTIPDEFPIPRQSEIIQSLSGAQVLSCFDALAGFTQLDMADEAKEKTAFRCHLGLWQFKRMPFGLRNGPSVFQRIMQSVLAPYLWLFTLVYIDDIVIFSKSWEEHLQHLDIVLGEIAKAGITLSPAKCFVGYSSILLLGQKVSRLGLSTHEEKVRAIQDLERPKHVLDLQKFLGMVVYFAAYIPYYAFIASPLFALLKKGVKWQWSSEHEIAFQQAKDALASAPVLGHPIQGQPYRLYTDASDYAIGACLQQIQPIRIGDLKGTSVYERLLTAWNSKLPVPSLTTTYVKDLVEFSNADAAWGESFEETIVYVERVIAYWSRSLKPAERNYSATEREALGAKEALVKFQPFVEGERIILITDHSALQWARVYENANRRLAAWGAVFAAFPDLHIVHRPGRIHSNVDPLSRLPRIPEHDSPTRDATTSIIPSESTTERAQAFEENDSKGPALKASFVVSCWEDVVHNEVFAVQTRSRKVKTNSNPVVPDAALTSSLEDVIVEETNLEGDLPFPNSDPWTYPTGVKKPEDDPSERWTKGSKLLVGLSRTMLAQFVKGYKEDSYFSTRYASDDVSKPDQPLTPSRFQKGSNGLLYFIDATWQARLCVPKELVPYVLGWIHDSPYEGAHAGFRRYQARLRELFFWPTLIKDADTFASTCDVCQKTKSDHLKKMGGLRPAHVPSRPFETVSLDLITGLPPSGPEQFTAMLVVVDKLTKYGIALPTHDVMDKVEFANVFVKEVVNKYGLPNRIISDRDKRWTSDFWRSIVSRYGSLLALSSAHHPQTDGQTENLNATIELMLRGYVAKERDSWAAWLSDVMHAYNSAVHSSTGYTPDFLLMGYQPRVSSSVVDISTDPVNRPFLPSQQAEEYVAELERHRSIAKESLILAQERQAKAYNKGRRPLVPMKEGDLVLVNPHTLALIDVKGTGRKLIQRTIGPFEIMEVVNPMVYRLRLPDNFPMHPVFNLDHLKAYRPSPAEFGARTELPSTRDLLEATEEYEVEAILGHKLTSRKRGNNRMYLVRWLGYGPEDDSWVSEYDLRNAPELRREYLRLHSLPSR